MTRLLPGLADPVADAQSAFRAALDAVARPGRVRRLAAAPRGPAPLSPAAAALLLALADAETPVWLDAGEAAADWLRFHAGCPVTGDPGEAEFLLAAGSPPALDALRQGSDEAPQDSATLILQLPDLGEGGTLLRLDGPGVEGEAALRLSGWPEGLTAALAANRARFPRGCDLLLCAGESLAALPRTTRVREG